PLSTNWHAAFPDPHKADASNLQGFGDYQESPSRLQQLVEQVTLFVRWVAAPPEEPGDYIDCDNFQGGHDITAHLLERGCRRIAFLGHASEHYPEFRERWRGYQAALREAGIEPEPELQADAITTEQSGYQAARALLDTGQPLDRVFGARDPIALGAMQAPREAALAMPE